MKIENQSIQGTLICYALFVDDMVVGRQCCHVEKWGIKSGKITMKTQIMN